MTESVASITALIGLVMGLANLFGLIYVVASKLSRLELKTDTMWRYLFEAAFLDARQKGVLAAHSAFRLEPHVAQQFRVNAFGTRVITYYQQRQLALRSDSEVTWELFKQFKAELVEQICLPLGLNMGAALVAAVQLCRDADADAAKGSWDA